MFADELGKMEVKLKEQLKTNENLKLQLAAEEDRYKVSSTRVQVLLKISTVSNARSRLVFFELCMAGIAQGSSLLMLSLLLVSLTVLFMSRTICETTFYCCLCQALETSKAWLTGVLFSCLANAVLGSGQTDICLMSQKNSNRLFCFEQNCT